MPLPLVWTDPVDGVLRRLRAEGATWDAIAAALRLSPSTVMARGGRIGARPPPTRPAAPPPDPGRDPLPPGDPASWGALTDRTLLAGAAFVEPA